MTTGFGAFGKLPSMGDFLRHNLPSGFVQTWDTWLQAGMLSLRETMAERWADAYMSAPIWRFTLPAGLAGAQAVSGIMMASVDRVGRQYPLTLAAPHDGTHPALTHFANRTVFERLEDIALAALDDETGRDAVAGALEQLAFLDAPQAQFRQTPYRGPHPAAQIIAAQTITQQNGESALWSAMMEGDHRLITTKSLPSAQELRALFDLNAPYWGTAELTHSL
ncbi:MAG: type VI secretion system-associated protein TagF [Pseudomonadota bacterium]